MGRLICNEDCFHCIYPDCIATPKKEWENVEKNREYKRKYYFKKKAEKEKSKKGDMT